jgi:membrane fusion protein, multidrug efflux system
MKQIIQFTCLFLSLGFFVTGCSSNSQKKEHSEEPVFKVRTQKIESTSTGGDRSYIGTIQESVSVPLSFLVNGTIGKVLADEGQSVSKGQLLATVNDESYRDAYQIAYSKQQQAEDAFCRLEPLYKKGSLPEIKYVEVKTSLNEARSLASISKKNLRDCKLYAPTSGVIGKRLIEPGMSAIMGNPALEIVKIETLKVNIPIPENEISGIAKGQKVFVRISALGEETFEGKVSEIGVLSNKITHTYSIKVDLKNPGEKIKPGMVCRASIQSKALQNRIVIPMSAVRTDGDNKRYVLLADSNGTKAVRRYIQVGPIVDNGVVINEGLGTGDRVITEGNQKIDEHSTIKMLN